MGSVYAHGMHKHFCQSLPGRDLDIRHIVDCHEIAGASEVVARELMVKLDC